MAKYFFNQIILVVSFLPGNKEIEIKLYLHIVWYISSINATPKYDIYVDKYRICILVCIPLPHVQIMPILSKYKKVVDGTAIAFAFKIELFACRSFLDVTC